MIERQACPAVASLAQLCEPNCPAIIAIKHLCELTASDGLLSAIYELQLLHALQNVTPADIEGLLPELVVEVDMSYMDQDFIRLTTEADFELFLSRLTNGNGWNEQMDASKIFAANAIYFPVAQYVSAHWGIYESGVRVQDDIHLSDLSKISESLGN